MQERSDARKVGCRKGEMYVGKKGYRIGEMQERRDAGKEKM